MKKKDVIVLVFASVVLASSIFAAMSLLSPKKNISENNEQNKEQVYVGDIDRYKDTIDELRKFNDYGGTTLVNIGRTNPFGPLN